MLDKRNNMPIINANQVHIAKMLGWASIPHENEMKLDLHFPIPKAALLKFGNGVISSQILYIGWNYLSMLWLSQSVLVDVTHGLAKYQLDLDISKNVRIYNNYII